MTTTAETPSLEDSKVELELLFMEQSARLVGAGDTLGRFAMRNINAILDAREGLPESMGPLREFLEESEKQLNEERQRIGEL